MGETLIYLIRMLKYGVEVNELDMTLKKNLIRLSQESSRIKKIAQDGMIYSGPKTENGSLDSIFIFEKI